MQFTRPRQAYKHVLSVKLSHISAKGVLMSYSIIYAQGKGKHRRTGDRICLSLVILSLAIVLRFFCYAQVYQLQQFLFQDRLQASITSFTQLWPSYQDAVTVFCDEVLSP